MIRFYASYGAVCYEQTNLSSDVCEDIALHLIITSSEYGSYAIIKS